MKVTCSKQDLLEAVNIVSKAVPSNTTMSVLECILMQAGNGEIRLTANDMDLGIETVIGGMIEIAGMIAIDARMLQDVVRKLPSDDVTIENKNEEQVHIVSGKMNVNINARSGEEFSFLPSVEKKDSIQISTFTLKDIIRQTIFSIGSSDVNKVMGGVDLIIKNDQLRVTTLDGHRISIRKVQLKNIYSEQEVIIPGKALNEISKILPAEAEKEVNISFSDAHVIFEFNKTTVVSRLIDGKYIAVDRMMSSDYETKIKVNKKILADCIDRSMLFSKEGNKKPIVLRISDGLMKLEVNSSLGSYDEELEIEKQGKDIVIGFNPKFIMDALKVIDDDEIDMYMVNPRSPLYIKDEGEHYIYMILPINLS
ncbi:MAG: DNA polymerase III subunit beta [Lachnospiraceae bacterium]|nr:DNA polymerase III subunit beta [Lachnospiraceae bacterium]